MTFFEIQDWRKWAPSCGCQPDNVVLVQFVIAGNERRYGLRCETCGKINGNKPIPGLIISEEERRDAAARVINLAQSQEAMEAAQSKIFRDAKAKRAKFVSDWWARYDDYLRSEKWRAKRMLVLKRDGDLCQACLGARAVQVHHTTYRHVFNEPLFDLVGICVQCHDQVTAQDRSQIPAEA